MNVNQFLFCDVYFKKQQKNRVIDVIVDCRYFTFISQLTLIWLPRMNDYVIQGQIIEESGNLHHGMWCISILLFAHFKFTLFLRRLITFIISLCLLFPQHCLYDTGTNSTSQIIYLTCAVLEELTWTWTGKNLEKFFATYIDFCPFLLKVSLCPIQNIILNIQAMHYLTHDIILGSEYRILSSLTLLIYNIKILNSPSRSETPTHQN